MSAGVIDSAFGWLRTCSVAFLSTVADTETATSAPVASVGVGATISKAIDEAPNEDAANDDEAPKPECSASPGGRCSRCQKNLMSDSLFRSRACSSICEFAPE